MAYALKVKERITLSFVTKPPGVMLYYTSFFVINEHEFYRQFT